MNDCTCPRSSFLSFPAEEWRTSFTFPCVWVPLFCANEDGKSDPRAVGNKWSQEWTKGLANTVLQLHHVVRLGNCALLGATMGIRALPFPQQGSQPWVSFPGLVAQAFSVPEVPRCSPTEDTKLSAGSAFCLLRKNKALPLAATEIITLGGLNTQSSLLKVR